MSNFRETVKFRPCFEVKKNFGLLIFRHVVYHIYEARDLAGIRIYSLFRNIFKYLENMSNKRVRETLKAFLKSRNLNISPNELYIRNLQITCFKMIYYITCLCSMSLIFFRTPENGLNFEKWPHHHWHQITDHSA